jgi:hypothetical protein
MRHRRDREAKEMRQLNHIGGFGKKVEDIWQEAAEWIYSVYDAEEIEVIYFMG